PGVYGRADAGAGRAAGDRRPPRQGERDGAAPPRPCRTRCARAVPKMVRPAQPAPPRSTLALLAGSVLDPRLGVGPDLPADEVALPVVSRPPATSPWSTPTRTPTSSTTRASWRCCSSS